MTLFRKTDDDIPKKGVMRALLAAAYVVAVVAVISSLEKLVPDEDNILMPIAGLLMLTTSAAVMASLVFGTPVMLYLDGKKREAVRLVGWTIGSLAAITMIVLVAMTQVA